MESKGEGRAHNRASSGSTAKEAITKQNSDSKRHRTPRPRKNILQRRGAGRGAGRRKKFRPRLRKIGPASLELRGAFRKWRGAFQEKEGDGS